MVKTFEIAGVVAAFLLGAFAGNFYHLIVHRAAGGGCRVILPPSCPACGRAERRIWMLPVLWFLILRGKCPVCGHPYRRRILWLEIAGGALAALLFYYYGFTLAFAAIFLFCCFFFMNYVVEFRYGLIVPQLYFPALAIGLALSLLPGDPSFANALGGGLVGGGALILTRPFRREGSPADRAAQRHLALISLLGVFLGWPSALFVLAAAAAAAWVLPLVFHRVFKREAENVFSLAVLTSALIMAFFHSDISFWYFRVR